MSRNYFTLGKRVIEKPVLMRNVLVEYARHRDSGKGDPDFDDLPMEKILTPQRGPNLIALDDALTALAKMDPRQSKIVELSFFGGLTLNEIAQELDLAAIRATCSLRRKAMYSSVP